MSLYQPRRGASSRGVHVHAGIFYRFRPSGSLPAEARQKRAHLYVRLILNTEFVSRTPVLSRDVLRVKRDRTCLRNGTTVQLCNAVVVTNAASAGMSPSKLKCCITGRYVSRFLLLMYSRALANIPRDSMNVCVQTRSLQFLNPCVRIPESLIYFLHLSGWNSIQAGTFSSRSTLKYSENYVCGRNVSKMHNENGENEIRKSREISFSKILKLSTRATYNYYNYTIIISAELSLKNLDSWQ